MTMQLYIGNRAQRVKNYETENYITTTVWLAQSTDLNIIENIWLKIKRDLQSVATNIGSHDESFKEIRRIWGNISLLDGV